MKPVIFDIECYPNFFLSVFFEIKTNEIRVFEISNRKNELKELREYCKEVSWYIGYNNKDYDCPLLEYVLKGYSNNEIFKYSSSIIDNTVRAYTKLNYIDLMLVNNYGIYGPSPTSLKKLAFNYRKSSVADSPISFTKNVPEGKMPSVIKYCKEDVDTTCMVYEKSREELLIRKEMSALFNLDLRSLPFPALGESVFSSSLGLNSKEMQSVPLPYSQVIVKDLVFDYIGSGEIVDEARWFFNKLVLKPKRDKDGDPEYKFKKDQFLYTKQFGDLEMTWGLGGIHGCISPQVVESDDEYVIKTCDVSSMYPNLMLVNRLLPCRLHSKFFDLYSFFKAERFKHKKGTPLNTGFKLLLNLVFGKANSKYSIFFDPALLYTVTVNGQLLISWLCDMLSAIPDSKILIVNTDGFEMLIPRKYEQMYNEICSKWISTTGVELEFDEYSKLMIRNVNNYIGIYTSGKIKRKGLFCTYEDIVNSGQYSKDTSHNIIPLALSEWYINGTNPEQFIRNHSNIYDFLIGFANKATPKKGKFKFLLTCEEDGVTKFKFDESRLFRYYASLDGYTLSKLYQDSSVVSIHADTKITPCANIKKNQKFNNINYDWYISKVYEIINNE